MDTRVTACPFCNATVPLPATLPASQKVPCPRCGESVPVRPSTLNGVLAQRLVRKLCEHCREAYRPLPEFARHLGLPASDEVPTLYRPRGCAHCQSGYRGRIALIGLRGAGKSSGVMTWSSARICARSSTLASSRTLPGQS